MVTSNRRMVVCSNIEKGWSVITNLEDCSWRSDLDRIEVLEAGKRFVEYTKDGYPTTFTITLFDPPVRYEFDMENGNLSGHWRGSLTALPNGTMVDFTEEIAVKRPFMRLFAAIYLKGQQKRYFHDLKARLGKSEK